MHINRPGDVPRDVVKGLCRAILRNSPLGSTSDYARGFAGWPARMNRPFSNCTSSR